MVNIEEKEDGGGEMQLEKELGEGSLGKSKRETGGCVADLALASLCSVGSNSASSQSGRRSKEQVCWICCYWTLRSSYIHVALTWQWIRLRTY